MTVDFHAFLQAAEQRKLELGIVDSAEEMEVMRNKGSNRTEAKRELLGRAQKRAQKAGRNAVPGYF